MADDNKNEESRKPSSSKCIYEEGDRVLVPEPNAGELFYEAKVIAAEKEGGKWKFLVHYQGWNKKWDEWLSANKLIRDTEESREQEKEKLRAASDSMRKGFSNKSKKRKKEHKGDYKGPKGESTLHIAFPSSLKKKLIADWEHVTKQDKLVRLPRNPTVREILEKYANGDNESGDGDNSDKMSGLVYGIQTYFDKALPNILLYTQERGQCEKVLKNNKRASEVYGAEHLLRLCIKLPELLPYNSMDKVTISGLEKEMSDLITYIQQNESNLFSDKYEKR
mmetsp:Transcript_5262/g.10036  ORF Transcript_5262/g.10036 Transcript_5262/m.10036 type:complete len:279 (+) Transcript_5262:115-951(+)|eukprot:CAMPEP_0114246182 /NCGR_PEP_ID=MMETSP0058-20121206/12314_1 /TAXON_ID=36894 /ORGANISM="Pyramimonas parkeae, CCMP726" /LENGTH=278 /DNA_ID=CAMNT_0001359327 /DNA_START=114 /DNA_END=950 /DNA_ORIENTATION=+